MRVGIVGTGFMGSTHAAAWNQTPATIAGITARKAAETRRLAGQYGATVYDSLTEMLPHVDVVDICTPTHRHHEMALEAAAAGKHVICEKPLARTVGQAQEMIAACQAAGVELFVAHVVRFFPGFRQAKARVEAGEIGRPAVLRLTRGSFQPKKAADNWFLDFEKSGGMMLDLMIHDFDYARWVAGEVDRVFARKVSSSHPGAPVDHGQVILTHRGGTISHVEGSWAYPAPIFRTSLEIAGSNGLIQFDSDKTAPIGLYLHQAEDGDVADVALPSNPLSEDPFTTQVNSFYNSLVGDAPAAVSGADGLAALQIGLAAIESAESGRAVELSPLPELSW